MDSIRLFGVVALLVDLPEHHLQRGQVGTIVEIFNNDAFEVEFSDDRGHTYAMLALHPEQFIVLHYEPALSG